MKLKITTLLFATMFLFQFAYSQTIETIGMGVYDNSPATLYFTDLGTIDHVVVEAIFKSNTPVNGIVEFSDGDETYLSSIVPVENLYGNPWGSNPSYFQATFSTVDAGGITLDQMANLETIHSFIAYIYRTVDNGFVSYANMDHSFFFLNGEGNPGEYIFPLSMVNDPRDLTAKITISEMALDDRTAVITVSAGGVVESVTISHPNLGNSLDIIPITLVDVPGNATELIVSIYSPIPEGDSFITGGVVLDVENPETPEEFCTLTQGFYGNYGGMFNGQTTYDLLYDLLATDLYLGTSGNSLTLTQLDVDCLIGRLPGGGQSAELNGDATCDNPVGIALFNNGRFKNNLLAQAITFGLNLRLDSNLGSLLLSDIEFLLSDAILQELGSGATVNDLFYLVNDALGGVNQNVELGDLTDAMGNINDHFDECSIIIPPPPPPPGGDCGPCEGQMTSLSLEYLGDMVDATIKVYAGKIKFKVNPNSNTNNLIAIFTDVNNGDTISFVGTGNSNKLGSKVLLTVNDDNGNYTEIHTSCSQVIEVGMIYDDLYLLIAGTSHEGGPLCENGLNTSLNEFKSGTPLIDEMTTSSTYIKAYPNPLVSGSTIEFEVAQQVNTVVELIDLRGQIVKQLYNGIAEPGNKYSVLLNASELNTGIYFLRMVSGNEITNQKISVVH